MIFIALFLAWRIWILPDEAMPSISEKNQQTLYLLSAIAQSLAAVLALVFTISLVVAQLSSKYSHRLLASFFDKSTIFYILLFIISVLLPFWILSQPEINDVPVKFSLILSVICLLFLIPYFLRFKEKLDPERIIEDLKKKSLKQFKVNPMKEPEEIVNIDNFIMSAFIFKDYDTFNRGIESLKSLAILTLESSDYQIDER